MTYSALPISILILASPFSFAATTSFNFDTVNDTENFGANATNVSGLDAVLGIDGSTGVLTSTDLLGGDPQINFGPNTATLPAGEAWSTFTIRFRQLDGNPGDAGTAGAPYAISGTILFFNGTLNNRTPGGPGNGIQTQTYAGSGTHAGDTYNMTLATQTDQWQLMTLDLSNAPTLGGSDITQFRFDPVGNDQTKNFEIDFVEFVSVPVPEPTSVTLLALSTLGLIRRRR